MGFITRETFGYGSHAIELVWLPYPGATDQEAGLMIFDILYKFLLFDFRFIHSGTFKCDLF